MGGNRKKIFVLLGLIGASLLLILVQNLTHDDPSPAEAGQKPAREAGPPEGVEGPGAEDPSVGGGGGGEKKAPRDPEMEVVYAFDVSDKQKLVGYSDAVFVGRVEGQAGEEPLKTTIPGRTLPRAQFYVSVDEVIKGELSPNERVTVNQTGGQDPKTGKPIIVTAAGTGEHGDSIGGPLEPEKTYLFSTRYEDKEGWYSLSAQPFGSVPLEGPGRDDTLEEFREAEENQVDPLPDQEASGKDGGKAKK